MSVVFFIIGSVSKVLLVAGDSRSDWMERRLLTQYGKIRLIEFAKRTEGTMRKQRFMIILLGVAALMVLFSRCSREATIEMQAEAPAVKIEKESRQNEPSDENESRLESSSHASEETPEIETENPVEFEQASGALETNPPEEGLNQLMRPEEIEAMPSESVPSNSEKASVVEEGPPQEDEMVTETASVETEDEQEALVVEEMSAETVDQIEESLSVSDYAKGLALLAKLPVETVDRFVELRKDGFTAEEQAEVKAILLASYEGEDLEWIVEMYHKLQP